MTGQDNPTQADRLLSALGDGTRRTMVGLLAQSPASVSDLARVLGVTKTAVGQHIAILEACGLVRSEKTGRVRLCRIDAGGLDALDAWTRSLRGHWNANLARLGGVLGDDAPGPRG